MGAAWGTISGTLLADLVSGADSELLNDIQQVTDMPSLNPPEPFFGIGVRARIEWVKWQSKGEI